MVAFIVACIVLGILFGVTTRLASWDYGKAASQLGMLTGVVAAITVAIAPHPMIWMFGMLASGFIAAPANYFMLCMMLKHKWLGPATDYPLPVQIWQ